ncbi:MULTISPECIES: hypothetical protein [unclassified Bradyrhizobium]
MSFRTSLSQLDQRGHIPEQLQLDQRLKLLRATLGRMSAPDAGERFSRGCEN